MKFTELPKAYEPQKFEAEIYKLWSDSGYFNPDNLPKDHKEPYAIMMPPPNVTGILHLGHALENALMDTEIRYQRLRGKKTLLLPGTDHAAVATQAKVEKELIKSGQYKNPREELGREKFLEIVREFSEKSRNRIIEQIKSLGTSCDWSRLAYTFDQQRSAAVVEMFKRMYNDGLIIRGDRIINWDWKLQTTVSDDELVWEEEKVPFYYFKYGPFEISTARPETKFGDKYVVMHPDDERYKKYQHGQVIEVEWINGPVKATVIKDKAIDPEFGTGVMTITPWHDLADFEIAERHHLDKQQIIGWDGRLLDIAGEFSGQKIHQARELIVAKMQAKGLLVKIDENYIHRVAKSDRGGVVVEPQIRRQWFVAVNKEIPSRGKTLKDLMRDALTVGHQGDKNQLIKITPERFQKQYLNWIDGLHDWCISRQIWWGHRIPVWYCIPCHDDAKKYRQNEYWFFSEAKPDKCPRCGQDNMHQDNDTLDTWFSSGTWTFSTLGWPAKTKDLKTYHPTAWMQMGYEILFFWMARMILMSCYALDEIPFKEVYFHGMLRDKKGEKFSKSKGNAPDPLDFAAQYGTDSLRLSLLAGVSPGNDASFYTEKVTGYRNFVNKLWNISRFILMTVESREIIIKKPKLNTVADKWIWQEYTGTVLEITNLMNAKAFSLAAEKLYEFTWSKLADWYLEIAKIANQEQPTTKKDRDQLLLYILQQLLIMWHPFTPYVTELLWQQFDIKSPLLIAKWPTDKLAQVDQASAEFKQAQEMITAIRNVRADKKIPAKDIIDAKIDWDKLPAWTAVIERLARVKINESANGLEISGEGYKVNLNI